VLQGLGPLAAARRVAMNIDMTIGGSDVITVCWSAGGSWEMVKVRKFGRGHYYCSE
jgi:hypothetical protein